MMRKLALFLIISAAAVAQSSKATDKPNPAASAKPSPTVKASAAQASKPAVIAVQPVTAKGSAPTTVKAATVKAAAVKAVTVPAAKPPAVAVKPASVPVPAAKPTVAAKAIATPAAKPVVIAPKTSAAVPVAVPAKPVTNSTKVVPVATKASPFTATPAKVVAVPALQPKADAKRTAKPVVVPANSKPQSAVAVSDSKAADKDKKPAPRSVNANGRRDPFISPVVNMSATGSGCSAGKRCLSIDQIALRGIVRAETGMIAVVVNAMDKAYFLRENDPVFNGYVVKITGDSVIFKETYHDRLGKSLTRDVTKSITRPVA